MPRNSRVARSLPTFETLESRSLLSASGLAVVTPVQSTLPPEEMRVAVRRDATTAPSDQGTGITGEYFAGNNFQQPVLVRSDATINFAPGFRPDPTLASGAFSVRWTGQVQPLFSQTYTFSTRTTDGVRLWVNGQLLIDSWTVQTGKVHTGTISLTAGQKYDIRMDYFFSGSGRPLAMLSWSSHSQHKRAIQKTALFPDANVALPAGSGLIGQYFVGDTFQQLALTRNDKLIDFNFGRRSPDPVIPTGAFSIRLTGKITAAFSETYTFYTRADDGVRLFVNGQLVVNDFTKHRARERSGTIALQAGVPYDFTVEYFEIVIPPASLQVSWSSPSTPKEIVPAEAFTNDGELTAGAVQVTGTSTGEIDLAWAGSLGATGYIVQRSADAVAGFTQIGTTLAPTTTFADTGLAAGTTYFYRIIATNSAENSPPDNPVSGTTLAMNVLAAPTNLTAAATSDTTALLNWNDVTGEMGFTIQSSPDGVNNWTTIATVGTGTTTLAIGNLTASTTYHYRVLATSGSDTSPPSNVATVTTDAAIPSFASLAVIYGLSGTNVYSIDTTTGAETQIDTILFNTEAAGRDPVTGKFYYVSTDPSNVQVATWDPSAPAGSANAIVNNGIAVPGGVLRAAFRSDGTFFFTASNGDLYSYNTTTNTATALGTIKSAGNDLPGISGDMAFGPDGNLYLEANSFMYEVNGSDITRAGGPGSTIPAMLLGPTGTSNLQIAFGNNGVLFGVDLGGQLYSVNLFNGGATPIPGSTTGVGLGDMASTPLYADLTVRQNVLILTPGANGIYTIAVFNNGPDATIRPITVTDTLPTGLSFVSAAGTGWTFNVQGQTITMSYAGNVAANSALPAVTLTVAVSNSAPASVINTVAVSTAIFDPITANNSNSLMTAIGS